MTDPTVERELPAGRRRLFAVLTLLFPLVLLGAVELGLRLAGVGSSYPLFVDADTAGAWRTMNPRVAERYFFRDIEAPGATRDPFRAERRPETLRIVVQGGSTALGFPFFYGGAFPRMLEDRLQRELPEREVEVINTALTAVNSHTLLDLADEIVEVEPDVVLIYAGHNEYYGALGVGSTLVGGSPAFVDLYLDLRRLRLVQLLSAAWSGLRGSAEGIGGGPGAADGAEPRAADGPGGGDPGATTMARMVGERSIPLGSGLYHEGERQLRRNLHALLETYEDAGIPVLVATLVSNERDQPPFVSGPDPDVPAAAWDPALAAARRELERGRPGAARTAVEGVVARDSANAAGFYALARLFDAHGDAHGTHDTARELYRAARDRDQLRFRAPGAFNALIRDEAAEHGARVVEVEEAFARASPDGIPGSSLLTEHLHPRVDGYFLMADAFHDALLSADGPVGRGARVLDDERARRLAPVTAVDSLYGLLLIESLTAGWPFLDDPARERAVLGALHDRRGETREEELALALFRGGTTWGEAMEELFVHLDTLGRRDEALRVARAVAGERPLSHRAVGRVAALELGRGDRDEALRWFRRAAEVAPPDDPAADAIVGAVESLPELEARVRVAPGDTAALFELAAAWALTNQPDTAASVLRTLLEVSPGHARARSLLEMLERQPAGATAAPGGGARR